MHANYSFANLVYLVEPPLDVCEGVPRGHVIDDDDPVGAAVVGGGDGPEALLPGRVPDLQLDALAADVHRADLEVDADRRDVVAGEGVVGEADEEGALAHAGVADDEQLEEVVVVLAGGTQRHDDEGFVATLMRGNRSLTSLRMSAGQLGGDIAARRI